MGAYAYLTNLTDLKNLLKKYPDKIKYFAKYDTFIGESDSIDYIEKEIKKFHKKK